MAKQLKIAFIVRSTIDRVKGGDSLQVFNTAAELQKLGVKVEIKKSTEHINHKNYDLLHFFNIIRPADHLKHVNKGVPYVVSTIYLDYSQFDVEGRTGLQKRLFTLLGKDKSEFFKNSFRFVKGQDKLVSKEYLIGHERAVKKILIGASLLLPNSKSEYMRLMNDYKVEKPFHVIPNGINLSIFKQLPKIDRVENQVVCVGQLYGLKNQHRLIEATRDMDVRLILIGKPPPNHQSYGDYCKKIAHKNVHFHDFMPQEQLVTFYVQSKVHALPSWFETTGLSSLEAGSMGCNLVVGSGGDTHEYFDGFGSFCRAEDVQSIKQALETELNKTTNFGFREHILKHYTWQQAAVETYNAYKKVLHID